jgi:hypothetical protein
MSCQSGKIEHRTVTSAQAHADSIFRKDGHQPNVYVCPMCGFFHVGGGRASDRPVHRPAPIVTTPKPVFTPKKIDKGHKVSVDDLIVDKLRKTFLTDEEIATQLKTDPNSVKALREQHKIPESRARQENAILNLLAANPRRRRTEIAKVLGIEYNVVLYIAQKLGLSGQTERIHGVKHHLFGLKQSKKQKKVWENPDLRRKLSEAVKTKQWSDKEKSAARRQQLIEYNKRPDVIAKRREAALKQWSSPEAKARRERNSLRMKNGVASAAAKKLTKAQRTEALRTYWASPAGQIRKQQMALANKNISEKDRTNLRAATRRYWASPEGIAKRQQMSLQMRKDKTNASGISRASRAYWASPEGLARRRQMSFAMTNGQAKMMRDKRSNPSS